MDHFTHEGGRHIAVDGARLYVETCGEAAAPPLLLLHGGFGNIEEFNVLTPALAPHRHLVGIDGRGQGSSTLGPEPLTYARLQQDVEAVCAELGLGTVDLLGYSDGGIVGLRLAASPGGPRIGRLATIGAHWLLGPDDPTRAFATGLTAESCRRMLPREYEAYQRLNPEPDFARLVSAIRRLWLGDGATGYPGESVRRIAGPLLVVRGDDDDLVIRAQAVGLADRVPGARLLNLPFAGHAVHEDQPDLLASVLLRFLETA